MPRANIPSVISRYYAFIYTLSLFIFSRLQSSIEAVSLAITVTGFFSRTYFYKYHKIIKDQLYSGADLGQFSIW